MNIEEFRTYCLSFPGACDKMPFDKAASEYDRELLVFCVRDKWFCFVHIREFDFCCLKCDPDEAIDLRDRYEGIEPGYHMNKRHCQRPFRPGCSRQRNQKARPTIV